MACWKVNLSCSLSLFQGGFINNLPFPYLQTPSEAWVHTQVPPILKIRKTKTTTITKNPLLHPLILYPLSKVLKDHLCRRNFGMAWSIKKLIARPPNGTDIIWFYKRIIYLKENIYYGQFVKRKSIVLVQNCGKEMISSNDSLSEKFIKVPFIVELFLRIFLSGCPAARPG